MSDTILTIQEVVNTFSEGLPPEQVEANFKWLEKIYMQLNDGGVLGIPSTGQLFEKKLFGFIEKVPVEQ